ncbi:MAG TPA: hypothetical protein VGA56_08935 [Opitutaceae bacterium]
MNSRHLLLRWLLPVAIAVPAYAEAPAPVRVSLGFIGSEANPAFLGVRQGLEEANLQGRFLGQEYQIQRIAPEAIAGADLAKHLAILVAADAGLLLQVAAKWPDHAVLNVSSGDESLRAACIPNLLHVMPSDGMRDDAVEQWRKKTPGAQVSAVAWHPEFMKFAGRDLNKRFRAAFGSGMDDYAWAGWAAVKMVSDMVARRGPETPGALLGHLKSDLAFDGQKGIDLSFRATGQLRQPLLLVEGGKLVGEAPVRGVAASDADLDSLGRVECPK